MVNRMSAEMLVAAAHGMGGHEGIGGGVRVSVRQRAVQDAETSSMCLDCGVHVTAACHQACLAC